MGRTTFFALAAGLALAGAPSRALADEASPLASSLTGDARAAYDAGKLLYEDRDYAGAGMKFRAAFEASHDARLLWNIATCEKELRHYGRAAALVQRFLVEAASLVPRDFLTQADATLATLRQFYSSVTLDVQPASARVTVDGEEVGKAPLKPITLDLGTHRIHAEREGYLPYDDSIEVTGHAPMSVPVRMKMASFVARLAVTAGPADSITIDEQLVATGPWEGTVSPGTHWVTVSGEGRKTRSEEIEIAIGERKTLEFTLRPGDEDRRLPLWPFLAGGAVVVAGGLVVGGYFLFRTNDQPATPPAGRLGTVVVGARR